jgi:hypothetical protein
LDFIYENPEIEGELRAAGSLDALEAALQKISRLVPSFMSPAIRGRQMFCPGLDAAIPELVRKLKLADVPLTKSNENVCIVATRFYNTGGHSKVAADITRIIGRPNISIVATDIYRQLKQRQLMKGQASLGPFEARSFVILSAPTMLEKIVELYMVLAAIRPSRIFLIQNHMDLTAVAGVWPFRSVVEFVHHADHMPTLGATLPFSGHLDLTYTCHLACKEAGLDPTWLGMTVEGAGQGARSSRGDLARLRIATCATNHKYRQPARHRWADFVIAALQRPGAEFLHIGPWDEPFADEVHGALAAAGIDPARYRFMGPVANLRQTLVDEGVGAYVASYPDSGGKATMEAMAAGIAPIVPVAEDLGPLLHLDLPLEWWVRISDPAQLPDALERSLALSERLSSVEGQGSLREEFNRFEAHIADPSPGGDHPRPATT